jgi:hypothetical protein
MRLYLKPTIRKTLQACLILLAFMGVSGGSRAAVFTIDATTVFDGNAEGSTPSLTAVFTDLSTGTVRLTLSASGLTSSELPNVNTWWFDLANNVASTYNDKLTFTFESQTGTFTDPSWNQRSGLFQSEADSAGYYDFWLNGFGSGSSGFADGDSITYNITSSASGLVAADFIQISSTTSGSYTSGSSPDGNYYSAVELNDGQDSPYYVGATAVPEPAAGVITLLGLATSLGVLAAKRRKVSAANMRIASSKAIAS